MKTAAIIKVIREKIAREVDKVLHHAARKAVLDELLKEAEEGESDDGAEYLTSGHPGIGAMDGNTKGESDDNGNQDQAKPD